MLDLAIKTSSVTFERAIPLKWAWQKPGCRGWWRQKKGVFPSLGTCFLRFSNSDKEQKERSKISAGDSGCNVYFPYRLWIVCFWQRDYCVSASHPITFHLVTEKNQCSPEIMTDLSTKVAISDSKCQAPDCWQTPTSHSEFWQSQSGLSLSRSCGYSGVFSLVSVLLFLISGFIYKRNPLVNLPSSTFGFSPLSRPCYLKEISLLNSEFSCNASVEWHSIYFAVFILPYIPKLAFTYFESPIFIIFIKFTLIAKWTFMH